MATVTVYPIAGGYQNGDVLMLEQGFEEDLRAEIAANANIVPQKCFAVSEENLNKYGYTLSKYLSYRSGCKVEPFGLETYGRQIQFFERWEGLVVSFNSRSLEAFMSNAGELYEVHNDFFPTYNAVIALLRSFSKLAVLPLLDCSPFYGRDAASSRTLWFRESVNCLQDLRSFIGQWEQFKSANMVRADSKLNELVIFTRRQVAAWDTFQKMNANDRCFYFSAFMYGLAETHYNLGNWVVSLLCLHRAVDVYLQYCGLESGVMLQCYRGVEYDTSLSTERVSILVSLRLLESNGYIAPDTTRTRDLGDLNESRNKLVLTHCVYGIKRDDLKRYLLVVEKWIAKTEGSTKWSQIRQNWFPLPTLSPDVIFDVETSIDTYIKEINLIRTV